MLWALYLCVPFSRGSRISLITLELRMRTTRPLATFKLLFNNMSVWSRYGDGGEWRGMREREGGRRVRLRNQVAYPRDDRTDRRAGSGDRKAGAETANFSKRDSRVWTGAAELLLNCNLPNLNFFPRHLCEDKAYVQQDELERKTLRAHILPCSRG